MTGQLSATERLERLLSLIPWVAAHSDGVPVNEVCERFAVDPDVLARDIDTVMMVGVHPFTPDTMIEAWIEDDRVWIQFAAAFARPLRLTADEAVMLTAAARGVSSVQGADDDGPLQRALAKLEGIIGGSTPIGVDLGPTSASMFDVLDRARAERLQVEIAYAGNDDPDAVVRRIEPVRLFSAEGHWYVSAWCHLADDRRLFRLDRILRADPTDEPFTHSDVGDAAALDFDPSLPRVVLDVDRDMAWLLDPVPFQAREEHGSVIRVDLAVGSGQWLARLLLQLGPAGRVVDADPALDVTTLVASLAQRVLERYR